MPSKAFITAVLLVIASLGAYLIFRANDLPPGNGTVQTAEYVSEELGISFDYRTDYYEIQTQQDTGTPPAWQALVLLPKGYVPPEGGEGPPSIAIQKFANPAGTALEAWITSDQRSNYQLLASDTLEPTTLAGQPAFSYQHSGLYETDAVALAHGDSIYLFSASWMMPSDRIRTDFKELLDSLAFAS